MNEGFVMKRSNLFSLFILVLISPGAAFGATIHVPGDQPTIQAGIDAAVSGDLVLVAPGYKSGDAGGGLL